MKKGTIIFILIGIFIAAIILSRFTGWVAVSTDICRDTDGGKDYMSRGKVEGTYYLITKEDFSEQDYCENKKILVEHYCVQEGMHSYKQSVEYECEQGCEDGKCI